MKHALVALLRNTGGWLPWVVVFAVAFWLRYWQLPGQLLADDEWHALNKLMFSTAWEIARSFGYADHTIPLTLYYKLLAVGPGLDEWSMRLPLFLAGLGSVVLMPWLLRDLARADEKWIYSLLLAVSPLLVYFSRTARPYALSVLLAFAALCAFRHWWAGNDRRWGAVYVLTCAGAAWLHPLTLAATLAPFLYHGMEAVWTGLKGRDWRPFRRLVILSLLTLIPLVLLLGPPVLADYQSLAGKAGMHQVTPLTVWRSLELFAGSAWLPLVLVWLTLVVFGAALVARRAPASAGYWLFVIVTSTGLVVLTGGAWIHHPLVLSRYLLPLLPVLLFFVAVALAAGFRRFRRPVRSASLGSLAVLLYLAGPLPGQYHGGLNQFTGHMSYQFDYQPDRNIYNQQLRRAPVPGFYRDLAEEVPRSLTLVKVPWYIEWHWNNWHLLQEVHQQRVLAGFVSGLCVEQTFGEYPPGIPGIELQHVVHLSSLVPEDERADFLVVHREPPVLGARAIPGFPECLNAIEQRLGPAFLDDGDVVVFDLRARGGGVGDGADPVRDPR